MADMMQNPDEQQPQGQVAQQAEPLPQGASYEPMPLPEGATYEGAGPQAAPAASAQQQPPPKLSTFQNLVLNAAKAQQFYGNIGKGAWEEMGDTVHGVGNLINKGIGLVNKTGLNVPKIPEQGLNALDQMTKPETTAEKIGFGGMTLVEFLMGDEALKGMSLAEKMASSAKIMDILGKSPRLLEALKAGANMGKAEAMLGPEELALVKKYPVLGRLISAGMDAIRQGTVQAAQTGVKTGDPVKAAKEGATMTGISAAIGAPLGVIGGVLDKGKQAAQTVQKMSKLAESAPEKTEVAEQASNMVQNAQKGMHTDFQKGIDQIRDALGDQSMPLKGSPFQQAAEDILALKEGTHPVDKLAGDTAPVSEWARKYIKGIASSLEKEAPAAAEGAADPLLVDALGRGGAEAGSKAAAAAEAPEPVMMNIDNFINARQKLGERMRSVDWKSESGRADWEAYHKMIEGIDDSIEQMVKKANPLDDTRYMMQAMDELYPGKQSLGNLTSQELGQVSQKAAELKSKLSPTGIYSDIRANYRKMMSYFNDPEVRKSIQSIMTGNLDDLGRELTTSTKAGHRIDTLRNIIGEDNMNKVADNIFKTWIKDAATTMDKETGEVVAKEFDPDKLLKKYLQLKPNVRDSLFKLTPERATAYNQFAKEMAGAASFKKLVKYGLLPVTLGTAGVVHGPLAAMFGAMAGLGIEGFGRARDILDNIANNPKTWNAVSKMASATASKGAELASTVTKAGLGKAVNSGMNPREESRKTGEAYRQRELDRMRVEKEGLKRIFGGASQPLSQPQTSQPPLVQPQAQPQQQQNSTGTENLFPQQFMNQ